MKKLSLSNLKLGEKELISRKNLKNIVGGYGNGGGPCSVYIGGLGWISGYSVADDRWAYNNDSEATGYCCASC